MGLATSCGAASCPYMTAEAGAIAACTARGETESGVLWWSVRRGHRWRRECAPAGSLSGHHPRTRRPADTWESIEDPAGRGDVACLAWPHCGSHGSDNGGRPLQPNARTQPPPGADGTIANADHGQHTGPHSPHRGTRSPAPQCEQQQPRLFLLTVSCLLEAHTCCCGSGRGRVRQPAPRANNDRGRPVGSP